MIMQPQPAKIAQGPEVYGHWDVYLSMVTGLAVGVAIGKVTEYYTSEKMAPAQTIAQQSQTGAATTTSSTAARCGSPTVRKPTGCACSPIPARVLSIATSR